MSKEYSYWYIGYDDQILKMTDKTLSLLSRGLLECDGRLLDNYIDDGGFKNKNMRPFSATIGLPLDKVEEFKIITGFKLTEEEQVSHTILYKNHDLF